jgi:hypothetical protein
MSGRTVILVSHHVQLCFTGASYIVALDNGHLLFAGDQEAFKASHVKGTLVHTAGGNSTEGTASTSTCKLMTTDESLLATLVQDSVDPDTMSETSSTVVNEPQTKADRKAPRKLVEDEKRAVGRVSRDVWELYVKACGAYKYWAWFSFVLVLGALCPVAENWWLKYAHGHGSLMWHGLTPHPQDMVWIEHRRGRNQRTDLLHHRLCCGKYCYSEYLSITYLLTDHFHRFESDRLYYS